MIGINDYQNLSPLWYARNDAEAVATVLKGRFGFPDENVRLLVDENATRDAIMAEYLGFTATVDPDDRVLLYFAGHGITRPGRRGDVGFLAPVDGDSCNLATLIRWDELTRSGEIIPAKHLLFLMDACYGGLAITRHARAGSMRFLKDMLQRYSRQVLTAGKADEAVADSGGPRPEHSVFTGHLLDALEGAAAQRHGVLTANSLMAYVYEKVGQDQFSNQTPHYGFLDGDGDFVFDLTALAAVEDDPQVGADILVPSVPPLSHPEPPEQSTVVERVKEYLGDRRYRIKLHDLLFSQLRDTLRQVSGEEFSLQKPEVTTDSFIERLRTYEQRTLPLQELVTVLATWGDDDQHPLVTNALTQAVPHLGNGMHVWIGLRWYPAVLLLYSAGIGALSQKNFGMLREIFQAPLGPDFAEHTDKTFLRATVQGWLNVMRTDVFKMVPGHERQYVPDKEYLFKVVQPTIEDLLYLGRRYEPHFDRFEVLVALVYAEESFIKKSGVWGPLGRFGWKFNHHAPNDPFSETLLEAAQAKDEWPPIKAGLFRSYKSFQEVSEKFREILLRQPWM